MDNNINLDIKQLYSSYHRISLDENQQVKIVRPWFSWLVTVLLGWKSELNSELTAKLFNLLTNEIRKGTIEDDLRLERR